MASANDSLAGDLIDLGAFCPRWWSQCKIDSAGQGEEEGNLVSSGYAVGEVVKEAGNALEAPAREAVINFNLGLTDLGACF